MWLRLKNKLAFLFRGDRFDRELAEELDFHRHPLEADKEREGLDKEAALLSARRQMGNTTAASEDSREAWLIGWLDTLARDLRYGLRVLLRNPGFGTVAVLTLGLGIGATTAIFCLVDLVMLRMLPVRQPEELLVMRGVVSFPRFERLRDSNAVFTGVLASHTLRDVALSVGERSLGSGSAALVTGNYFSLLGVKPVLGRAISTEDDAAPESSPVAVISHGLWKRAFGLSPDVLGRTLRLRGGTLGSAGTSGFEQDQGPGKRPDHASLTIVGVAPPEFIGDTVGTAVDVWVPIMMQPALMPGRAWLTRGTASWLNVMGRRRPDVAESQARASLTVLWRQSSAHRSPKSRDAGSQARPSTSSPGKRASPPCAVSSRSRF